MDRFEEPNPHGEEMVVLCGEDGAAIGTMPKSRVHHTSTPLHLAFSCYLFDEAGRLLTTRRALSKRTWPGVLTNSCCGHPAPGESIREAVARRLAQELGVVVDRIDLVLPRFSYRAVMADGTVENELCPVYRAIARTPVPVEPNPDEVHEAEWTPWAEFSTADPGSISPWAAEQIVQLTALGADPLNWPVRADTELPAAATA